ncbi:MAG: 5'-deoxyadenosine deaminase [Sandaracinaceae bacterium]|nr:5'-deoxyadenosine deaminase [Sandaracinaceae bacterium]
MIERSVLIRGGAVVTMDASRRVLGTGDVLIEDDRVVAVGPRVRPRGAAHLIDARGCAVLPGLVQAHVHLCQALLRGMADELPLMRWLRERIWPLEAAHDARSLRVSAELGLAELLLGGTTTILDLGTVHHQDAVFAAMARSGIRGISGKAMMDVGAGVPRGLRESRRASLEESLRLAARWDGAAGGRLGYAFGPRFILSCSEGLLRDVAREATQRGLRIHSHVAEHAGEKAEVRAQLGMDDVDALAAYGIAGPHVVLAHGVQLTRAQMKRVAAAGTRIVHCPSANLKLASGIADVPAMRDAGIVVGIGADGAPCNNRLDAFTELRQAALLAKVKHLDAAALSAMDALALATIDGARALGLDGSIGSLEAGKKADVIVVDLERLHALPGGDPVSRLVYAATAADVRHTFVDGRWIVRDGQLTTLDPAKVAGAARREGGRILARAGLAPPKAKPRASRDPRRAP